MKDAQGHGSNGRGRGMTKVSVTRPVGYTIHDVGPGGKRTLTASGTLHPDDASAAALASGPKSNPVPTHEAMVASGVRPVYARVSSKNGSKLGEYGPHATREAAAAEAFSKHPKARTVSTSHQHGFDIRYHNR